MKLSFVGALVSASAAACSAEPPADVATGSEDLGVCEAAPGSREVVLDLAHDVQGLRCQAMMGSFVVFTWENLFYMAWVSDDPTVCWAKLDALEHASAAGSGLHAVVRDIQTVHAKRVYVTSELTLEDASGPFALRASKCNE
jgi:hypothetical protein